MKQRPTSSKERILIAASLTVLLLALSGFADGTDLSGRWHRNPELSQDWRERLDAAVAPEADRDRADNRLFFERLRRLLHLAEDVEIVQGEERIELVTGLDEVRIFYFDRIHLRETPSGLKIRATCHWNGKDLIVEERTEAGAKIVEVLSISADGLELSHLLQWHDQKFKRPLQIRSVYFKTS